MNGTENITTKITRRPRQKVFIITETFAGKKKLSDIYADLLYSAYCKREPEITGEGINLDGYPPTQTGQARYGDSA